MLLICNTASAEYAALSDKNKILCNLDFEKTRTRPFYNYHWNNIPGFRDNISYRKNSPKISASQRFFCYLMPPPPRRPSCFLTTQVFLGPKHKDNFKVLICGILESPFSAPQHTVELYLYSTYVFCSQGQRRHNCRKMPLNQ